MPIVDIPRILFVIFIIRLEYEGFFKPVDHHTGEIAH